MDAEGKHSEICTIVAGHDGLHFNGVTGINSMHDVELTDGPARLQELLQYCATAIRRQIPVPVPQKVGAVVKTDQGVFLRWTYDAHSINPWIMASDVDTYLRTDEIGRIIEVLQPGIDL